MGGVSQVQPQTQVQNTNPSNNNATTSNTKNTGNTSASSPAILDSSKSLNTNTQLYMDLYNSQIDKANVNKLIATPNANAGDIKQWTNTYENDANKYKNDLMSVVGTYTGTGQKNDLNWAIKQLSDFNKNNPSASLFVDPATTQGPLARVDATKFPGGTQDDNNGVFEGPLQKGYIAPPDFPSNADLSQVYNNLSDDQAGYLGWALQQGVQSKELYLPAGVDGADLQKWNALATYASQNNPLLKQPREDFTPPPDYSNSTSDDKVNAAFIFNAPSDFGKDLLNGLTSLGQAIDPFSPIANAIGGTAGEIVDAVGGVLTALIPGVGEERFAGLGISAVGKAVEEAAGTGTKVAADVVDTATGLGKRLEEPVEDASSSFFQGADEAWKASNDQVATLQDVSKSKDFDNIVAQANATLKSNDVGSSISNDPAYAALKASDGADNKKIAQDFANRFNLSSDEMNDLKKYTSYLNDKSGPSLISGLQKLPTQAGDSFRYSDLSTDTINKIKSGQPLSVADLTGGQNIFATKRGSYADSFKGAQAKIVVKADTDKDGGTWIAPLSDYGLDENESVFYGGSFSVEGTATDSITGQPIIYLKHTA